MVLKTAAEPVPTFPDNNINPALRNHQATPEMQKLVDKRTINAARLRSLQSNGLCNHVAQALWRTATASDITFRARSTGLDSSTATHLDQLTLELWQQWLATPIEPADAVRIFASMSEGGFGFTSAKHIKDTALIASWAQVAPAILRQTNIQDMTTLLTIAPATRAQLQSAINNCDPALAHTIADIKHDTAPHPRQQKKLTAILRKHDQVQCTNNMNAEDMGVFLCTGGAGAGSWLHAPVDDIVPLNSTLPLPARCASTNR